MTPRLAFILVRHALRVWRAGQLRFRLETFGLYYPAQPYAARWWQISAVYLRMLASRLVEYGRWISAMEELQRRGNIRRTRRKRPRKD